MWNIPQAAIGEGVNASSKLPRHLQREGGEEKKKHSAFYIKICLTEFNDSECDTHNQLPFVPVHLWSYRGPLTLCGTQSDQRLGQKTDQPHTLQPYWEEMVKEITTNAAQSKKKSQQK